jgi:glycosyltransferase involved in cell wall biosynthesis
MKAETRSVSVVVPAFNAEATIGACVESLLVQDFPSERAEVIVVDNDSGDGTRDALRSYRGQIRVVHERKRGAAASRNAGIVRARGELVAFIDADCTADEGWLRNIAASFDDPTVGIVGGAIRGTRPCNFVERFGDTIHDNRKSIEVFRPPYVITMNCCMSMAALTRLNLFDERFRRSEDVELSYRAVQAGYRLVFRRDAIVFHRHPPTLVALLKKGFQHGFHSVRVLKRHRDFLAANGYRRGVDGKAYLGIASRLVSTLRGPERSEALCDAVFNSGKRAGKACGSIRFGYVDL